MAMIQEKINDTVRERYYSLKHPTGLDIFVIPKKHSTAYAVFGTKYGSMDRTFKTNSDDDFITVPDGIAHFLEHKMFENENGEDTFTRYARFGGSANAYTSFDRTAYLFSCTENFKENLGVLLEFVQEPYFTKESVEKEIGIIGQEIRMYDDNPGWQSYFGLLNAMFVNNPIKIDIAGTVESIAQITPEILYKCYNTFYNLNNMALVVCGDVNANQVIEVADKYLKQANEITITNEDIVEPNAVNCKRITKHLEVAMPLLSVGIKDETPKAGKEAEKRSAANEIIIQSIFGNSGSFYARHYEAGLINPSFNSGSSLGRGYAFSAISGSTPDPDMLFDEICAEIKKIQEDGLDPSDFERAKKVIYSSSLRAFDSTDDIANGFLQRYFLESDLFEIPEIIASVSLEYANEIFKEVYQDERIASSVILPNEK